MEEFDPEPMEEFDPEFMEEEFTEFSEMGSPIEEEIKDVVAPPDMDDALIMEYLPSDDPEPEMDRFPHHKEVNKDDEEYIDLDDLF